MARLTLEKLLQIIESVLKIILRIIDALQGDESSE